MLFTNVIPFRENYSARLRPHDSTASRAPVSPWAARLRMCECASVIVARDRMGRTGRCQPHGQLGLALIKTFVTAMWQLCGVGQTYNAELQVWHCWSNLQGGAACSRCCSGNPPCPSCDNGTVLMLDTRATAHRQFRIVGQTYNAKLPVHCLFVACSGCWSYANSA